MIQAINAKLLSIKLPRGKKRQAQLEFYRPVMTECTEFKDVWRNNVMHARSRYTRSEAMKVFIRVQDFMQRLAKKVIERN